MLLKKPGPRGGKVLKKSGPRGPYLLKIVTDAKQSRVEGVDANGW
jgi:hypothetical protein